MCWLGFVGVSKKTTSACARCSSTDAIENKMQLTAPAEWSAAADLGALRTEARELPWLTSY
jgi:hypothetical protein